MAARRAVAPAANKYGAVRCNVDGISFASIREASRYAELRVLERCGEIHDLELQPVYPLVVNGRKIGRFTGDFRYVARNGDQTVEDVKSLATARGEAYRLRKKLVEALYDIQIREVF